MFFCIFTVLQVCSYDVVITSWPKVIPVINDYYGLIAEVKVTVNFYFVIFLVHHMCCDVTCRRQKYMQKCSVDISTLCHMLLPCARDIMLNLYNV